MRKLFLSIYFFICCIVSFQCSKRDKPLAHVNEDENDGAHHLSGRSMEYKLVNHLLRFYDKRIRPTKSNLEQLNVTFGLALSQIIDVDEKNQIITTNCWLNMAWIDFQLSWKPEDWDGINVLRLPHDSIWLPDILLYNNADMISHFSAVSTNVIIDHLGNVTWLTMIIYKSTCSIDVEFFPFDIQNCELFFSSWTYDMAKVNLLSIDTNLGDTSNYNDNTEWTLLNLSCTTSKRVFSCCPDEPYAFVIYNIAISRRPLFYVYNLFLPCILITMVAMLGFFVPSYTGEKVSMGITTLLSMTVFLMVVAESMPPTKSQIPLLALYFGFTIIVVTCTTFLTVFTLNIHYLGRRNIRMPSFVRCVVFGIIAKFTFYIVHLPNSGKLSRYLNRIKRKKLLTSADMSESFYESKMVQSVFCSNLEPTESIESSTSECNSFDSAIFSHSPDKFPMKNFYHRKFTKQDAAEAISVEWEQCSVVIDRLIGIVFLATTVFVTMIVMSHMPTDDSEVKQENSIYERMESL